MHICNRGNEQTLSPWPCVFVCPLTSLGGHSARQPKVEANMNVSEQSCLGAQLAAEEANITQQQAEGVHS